MSDLYKISQIPARLARIITIGIVIMETSVDDATISVAYAASLPYFAAKSVQIAATGQAAGMRIDFTISGFVLMNAAIRIAISGTAISLKNRHKYTCLFEKIFFKFIPTRYVPRTNIARGVLSPATYETVCDSTDGRLILRKNSSSAITVPITPGFLIMFFADISERSPDIT